MSRTVIQKSTRERMKALKAEGYTNVRYERTNGGHARLYFTHKGQEHALITPTTPSDHRSMMNMLRDAKRAIQNYYNKGHTK